MALYIIAAPMNIFARTLARAAGALAVPVIILLCLSPCPAMAADDTDPPLKDAQESKKRSFSTGTAFFDDAAANANLFYFQRYRARYALGGERYRTNLDHATAEAGAEFISGFIGGVAGLDFGAFGAVDFYNHGAPDHEMNFVPWRDPWHPKWDRTDNLDGASIYKANLKFKAGPVWGRAGYFQPSGPSTLGVNWSLYPGTYLGGEIGADFGPLSMSAVYASQYKAPWYSDTFRFKQNDGETDVDYLWSAGARYAFPQGLILEAAYGESQDYLKNAHLKGRYKTGLGEGSLEFGYQLYLMWDSDNSGSVNDNFDGTAYQHYLFGVYSLQNWTLRLEGTYTLAPQDNPNQLGYFAYRLTVPNGSSKGAYEAWWDARSDWNHDREKAVFLGVSRNLDDIFIKGFTLGAGYALGWDGKAYGYSERLREDAWTFDLKYTVREGFLKNAWAQLHFTIYHNYTSLPSWVGFKNAFQDERDLKFLVGIPFSL